MASSGFSGGASGKEPTCQCRRHNRQGFSPASGKIPWRRKWQPTPVFLPGKSHGRRNLAGYIPWGRKELNTTEATQRLSMHVNDVFASVWAVYNFEPPGMTRKDYGCRRHATVLGVKIPRICTTLGQRETVRVWRGEERR